MIVFELICESDHRFEGWFASGEDFDSQRARGIVTCPVCGSVGVEKLPTAKIGRHRAAESVPAAAGKPPPPEVLQALIDGILAQTEDVGKAFPDEARRIHRDEAPQRAIRGVASRDETEALLDEGIPVVPLPIPPKGDWH